MATLNWTAIQATVAQDPTGQLQEAATERIREVFEDAVIGMQLDFDSHPVTQEIKAGVDAQNLSKTLPGNDIHPTNNLYSFIGFSSGDRVSPLDPIWDAINPDSAVGKVIGPRMMFRRKAVVNNNATFEFEIAAPILEAVFNATPLPWAPGLSWAEKIETGIPGFQYFLSKPLPNPPSQSGGGIQAKDRDGKLRVVRPGARYVPPAEGYLTEIFDRFIERVRTYNVGGFRQRFKTRTGVPR